MTTDSEHLLPEPSPDLQAALGVPGMLTQLDDLCRDVVDNIPDIVYRLDRDGNIVFISEAVRRYGYDPIALVGASIFDLVHPDDRDRARFRINERRTGDRSTKSLQVRLVSADDAPIPFELRDTAKVIEPQSELLVDAQGIYDGDEIRSEAFLYTHGVARDISERFRIEASLAQARARFEERLEAYAVQLRKAYDELQANSAQQQQEAQQRLQHSQQSYRGLVEDLPVGIAHTTPDGHVLYANPQVREMFGYSDAEWSELLFVDLYENPSDLTRLAQALQREGLATFEVPMRRKDGTRIWVRGTSRRVKNPVTLVQEDHGVLEDITQARQMEEEHRRLEDQLRQAQRMEAVGQLTAGISHNFNNMLQGISGNLQLALLDAPEPLQAMLQDADRVTHRAAQMVQQLIVFSRQGSRGDVHRQRLRPILQSALDICHRTFDRRIQLTESIPHELQVLGDGGLVQQAVLNMLINARDAVEENPEAGKTPIIDLQARPHEVTAEEAGSRPPGTYICIEIRDNGVGMDENTQHRIFEPFFTTKSVDRGTGLGLATVYGIASKHAGWLEVDSTPAQGTSIRLFLPSDLSASNASPAPDDAGVAPETQTARATLLIIDDEDMVRDSTARLLTKAGFRVLTAATGESGLELFTASVDQIDLVLLDLAMPTMSGHEVLLRMRQQAADVRVLILTGYSIGDVDLDALVLRKPFTIAQLEAKVKEALSAG